MSHAALVNDGLLWFLVFLTLLLVMFACAVIRVPPEPAGSREPPVLTPPVPPATRRPRADAIVSPAGERTARRAGSPVA